ncbi:MAG: hypothetical protein R3A44_14530 [Caldilineaceae bacterium]
MRFWASVLTTLSVIPFWLRWGLDQSERQIDKMQEAVFNSPGSQAPVTPPVLLASGVLAAGHLFLGLALFRLGFWRTLLSFLVSLAAGVGLFLMFLQRNE